MKRHHVKGFMALRRFRIVQKKNEKSGEGTKAITATFCFHICIFVEFLNDKKKRGAVKDA